MIFFTILINTDLFNLNILLMSATIGAAALTAGAGLLGSLVGARQQDKNAQAQREWQEKMYLIDRDYNPATDEIGNGHYKSCDKQEDEKQTNLGDGSYHQQNHP